jgi:YebC/PmpR family DNA-binding regulatory protein
MSGHSKWSTIKRQKGANDAKRGAMFTKLGNQIAIAARSGIDPSTNSALAIVIAKAKAANMPSANIERSIQRAADKDAAQLEEITYEGYGPGGVAVLVETATDNKNRTYPDVRLAFSKTGGNMAEPGSVAFQFSRKGVIRVKDTGDEIELEAIEAGAEDVFAEEETGETVVHTAPTDLAKVRDQLKDSGYEVTDAELTFVPNNTIEISDKETARKVINLMNALDDLDDVTTTHTNFDISEEIYNSLCEIIAENKPKIMVVEKLFFAQNVTTAISVSHARGVVMLAGKLAGLEIVEYTPLQIKQALTGYGRADKKQMQEMVKILLGLKEVPKPDDCADALAAALMHATALRVK